MRNIKTRMTPSTSAAGAVMSSCKCQTLINGFSERCVIFSRKGNIWIMVAVSRVSVMVAGWWKVDGRGGCKRGIKSCKKSPIKFGLLW